MKPKKNPEFEVGRNSSLYFSIGLFLMLLTTYGMLNLRTYDKSEIALDVLEVEEVYDEDIPITEINTPPPPPPPKAAVEEIVIVEDIEEVEETVLESTETSQSEEIPEYEVNVDDVNVTEEEEYIEVPFAVVEQVPVWPGCENFRSNEELKECFQGKIKKHLLDNFKYPEVALELGIYGRVYVLFNIDHKGVVSNIRTRGPDKILEKEAYRIISLLPKMKPGNQRGKPVTVPYSIPIHFKFEGN